MINLIKNLFCKNKTKKELRGLIIKHNTEKDETPWFIVDEFAFLKFTDEEYKAILEFLKSHSYRKLAKYHEFGTPKRNVKRTFKLNNRIKFKI